METKNTTAMHPAVSKLLENVTKHGNLYVGPVYKSEAGHYYRHDQIVLKYAKCATWLSKMFRTAAEAVGTGMERQFNHAGYGFSFDRSKFKGGADGKIYISFCVNMGDCDTIPADVLASAYKVDLGDN